MSIECAQLRNVAEPHKRCPACGFRFRAFLRGQVQRDMLWMWLGPLRPYCRVMCRKCKTPVSWEMPYSALTRVRAAKLRRERLWWLFKLLALLALVVGIPAIFAWGPIWAI